MFGYISKIGYWRDCTGFDIWIYIKDWILKGLYRFFYLNIYQRLDNKGTVSVNKRYFMTLQETMANNDTFKRFVWWIRYPCFCFFFSFSVSLWRRLVHFLFIRCNGEIIGFKHFSSQKNDGFLHIILHIIIRFRLKVVNQIGHYYICKDGILK